VHASTPFGFRSALVATRSMRARATSATTARVSSFVERWSSNGVKGTMNRMRAILTLLIPGLWLVASVNCLSDPVTELIGEGSGSAVSASRHREHSSSSSACSLEQSARRWSRRLNVQSGPDGLSGPAAFSQTQLPALDRLVVCSGCSHLSPGLANCWQFHWRTALDPRAPSSVS